MIVTTIKGKKISVTEHTDIRFVKTAKINKGCIRWFVVAILFWPLLIAYFFVGDTVYVVDIDGVSYVFDEIHYKRLTEVQ